MASLKGSKTEENLKAAFAGESQANRRYLYFAQKADVEGYNDVAAVFRSTAEGETGHAHGHLEYLEETGIDRRRFARSKRKTRGVRRERMASLKGSKTEENLKAAFAGESQANRRYLYFAQKADVEGYNDVAAVFRSTAEGETGHAHGHLEYLEETGDPATGEPIGGTVNNLKAAIAGETHEYTDMYPGMARSARDEGFDEIADWFETLAKAEKSHAGRFQKALDTLDS